MGFKIGWILLAIYTYIGIGLNSTPIKVCQQQYFTQVHNIQNLPKIRIDRINQIVDSEYDDATIMQKINQEKLY